MKTNPDIWNECISCRGECCKWETVLLSKREVERIKKATKNDSFYFKRKGYLLLKQERDGYCIFYDKKNHRCSIYETRPFDCQLFPFDIIKKNNKLKWVIWKFCPAVKKQKIHSETFKEFLNFIEVFEKRLLKEFTMKELIKYSIFSQPEKEKGREYDIIKEVQI